jgi:uncharacterized metal-binding protein YceD (DUF177 family)
MQIEFRKVPLQESEFEISSDSVKFSGTFSKISQKIAKVSAKISGDCTVECCKCGKEITLNIDENINLLVSDGIYSSKDDEEDEIVIEVENHMINFDDILSSELESLKSEYYICDVCNKSDNLIEIEY